jgi:hypothetical protein
MRALRRRNNPAIVPILPILPWLIDALMLWKRSPGGGKWPFAKDAPWHLMTRRTRLSAADYKQGRELQLHMQARTTRKPSAGKGARSRGPLSRDEVARRDEATEWLTWMAEDARRVVILALAQLAQGREAIDWRRVKAALGTARDRQQGRLSALFAGDSGVAERLNRALSEKRPEKRRISVMQWRQGAIFRRVRNKGCSHCTPESAQS